MWDVWDSVFHDGTANMALYDFFGGGTGLNVQENVIYFGSTDRLQVGERSLAREGFLRPKVRRYRDVDITLKVQIISTTKTDGTNENPNHWFGIAVRALRPDHWDAYLFYIRKNGKVEFGIRGNSEQKPPEVPISSQPVTVRVKAEGDRIQTWINGRPHHDRRDEQKEFIRKGDIYLIAYGSLVRIYDVEVKAKRWYAPIRRFGSGFYWLLGILSVIGGAIAFWIYVLPILNQLIAGWFPVSQGAGQP